MDTRTESRAVAFSPHQRGYASARDFGAGFASAGADDDFRQLRRSQAMRTVMVRYQVKPETAAENERLIREVFAQLARDKPAGLRYDSFKLADGVSFVHLAISESKEANPLPQLAAFKAFIAGAKERCVEPPVTVELSQIGGYDSLG
jgi:hypothetical protein